MFAARQGWVHLSLAARLASLALLLAMVLGAGPSCRDSGDGDADSDADSDADADSADGDDDDPPPECEPRLGGPCNAAQQCGCTDPEACALTAGAEAIEEVCGPSTGGAAQHGDDCGADPASCADGHICLSDGTAAACLRLCTDTVHCPERSHCDMDFTMSELEPLPYRACSPQQAMADAIYGVCVAPEGACPGAGAEERVIDSSQGATWSCTLDVSEGGDGDGTLNFELTDGTDTISGTNLVFPLGSAGHAPATCESFVITEGGVDYSPSECTFGIPGNGTCVVGIHFSNGMVMANFNCLEIPGEDSDVLTTMNGGELGSGTFALRACDITE